MFSLTLTDKEIVYERSGEKNAVGSIQIGKISETLHASLLFWNREDYFEQWRKAAKRILSDSNSCGLITNMVDPKTGRFVTWWPMYREGNNIYLQNALLFLENIEIKDRSNVAAWQHYLAPRKTVNEDGDRISEWMIDVQDVEKFLVELNERMT